MSSEMDRRTFVKGSLITGLAGSLAGASGSIAKGATTPANNEPLATESTLPKGRIGHLEVSRLLLGGNLLTHYTHSRDLKYVYKLAAKYNTEEKILETLALAETHGVNTLSIHTVDYPLSILAKHRRRGGHMQWIICPTAPVKPDMKEYSAQVQQLVSNGTDAIYLWGVHSDRLVSQNRIDLIAKAVEVAKNYAPLSGVGAHDLNVIKQCEKHNVGADFYIKTLHHHDYPTGPKAEELKGPYSEFPGYWCKDPQETVDFMKTVDKPWIAFKVMAAGAITPSSGFDYAYRSGADFLLAGMFDFEIEQDAGIAREMVAKNANRERPWRF
jgi:hypothetical protein